MRPLCLISIFTALAAGCGQVGFNPQDVPAEFALDPGRTEVPLAISGSFPLVRASVNGAGPFWFVVDSGTRVMMIDPGAAQQAGMSVLRKFGSVNAGGGRRTGVIGQVRVETLKIGQAEFRSFDAMVADMAPFRSQRAEKIMGVLGVSLFWKCRFTIDYPASKLILENFDRPFAQTGSKHRFMHRGDHLTISATIGRTPVSVLLDTGSGVGIEISEELAAKTPFLSGPDPGPEAMTATGKVRLKTGRVSATLALGPHRIKDPPVMISRNDLGFSASLGGEFFRHFAVTFDFRQSMLYLKRTSATPIKLTR